VLCAYGLLVAVMVLVKLGFYINAELNTVVLRVAPSTEQQKSLYKSYVLEVKVDKLPCLWLVLRCQCGKIALSTPVGRQLPLER
jgi:hypothetical protein